MNEFDAQAQMFFVFGHSFFGFGFFDLKKTKHVQDV
jgi:hypothetical protein